MSKYKEEIVKRGASRRDLNYIIHEYEEGGYVYKGMFVRDGKTVLSFRENA